MVVFGQLQTDILGLASQLILFPRSRIWNHLSLLGKSCVTTVITTHYIEEARQADRVGLMREGKLIVEEKPHDLMTRFGVDTLEKAFLHLCTDSQL